MKRIVRAGQLSVDAEVDGGKLRGITLPRSAPAAIRPGDLEKLVAQLEKLAPDHGEAPPFTRTVWRQLRKIPVGSVMTYGEIAAAIGRPGAARAVGNACGANPLPLFIPCHRAVARNGLGGFSGGLAWKRALLAAERKEKA
jgi:O-6-methylguanine DNA methyltransferase